MGPFSYCVPGAAGDQPVALQTRRFALYFHKIHHAKPEKFRTYRPCGCKWTEKTCLF